MKSTEKLVRVAKLEGKEQENAAIELASEIVTLRDFSRIIIRCVSNDQNIIKGLIALLKTRSPQILVFSERFNGAQGRGALYQIYGHFVISERPQSIQVLEILLLLTRDMAMSKRYANKIIETALENGFSEDDPVIREAKQKHGLL